MNLSAPFLYRPVATALLTVAVALAGVVGYILLPVAPLPEVDFPTISVSASLPGASAAIMASSVATPLERQLSQIADVTEMTSSSSLGNTSITLQFDLNRNIDGAARDVQAAISAARTYLPANLPQNPSYRKVNPADAPILILSLTSNKYDVPKLYDLASTVLEQKLSQVSGVGEVVVGGGATPAVRIEANPRLLASDGLTLADLRNAVSGENSEMPRGQIADGRTSADILTNGQITSAVDYEPLVVGYHNGAVVRVGDVAQVIDSTQNVRAAGYMDGRPSITLIIFRQPGANILHTVEGIRAQLGFLTAVLPAGVTTTVVLDSTTTIRASVADVERSLLLSILLVVLVTFLFLRNARATLIPSVAIPVSLLGTLMVMYLFGYTLDNLSLMALTISTGFVLDDAIVVMDNIVRYLDQGMPPFQAALQGAGEVGFTVATISLSLIAVFLPILLMGGIVGRLFREFAVTVSVAIVVSMVVSLTTTATLCGHMLKAQTGRHGRVYRASEAGFEWLRARYQQTLEFVLRHPVPTLLVLGLLIALNIYIAWQIPKGFFPVQDTGAIVGGLKGPEDASFPFMNSSILQIVKVIKADPAVEHVNAYTGGNGASNGGFVYVALKPLNVRKVSAMEVINRLRPKLNRLPAASVFLQPVQGVRIGGRQSNALYQYTLEADTVDDLNQWAPKLTATMEHLPGLEDVTSDQQNGGLAETLDYNRDAAASLGQTVSSLDQTVYDAFGQSEAAVLYMASNQYYVVLEAAPAFWQSPAGLSDVFFNNGNSGVAPLDSISPLLRIAKTQTNTTPLQINHTGLFPSVTVSFNLASNLSLSEAMTRIDAAEQRLGMPSAIRGFPSGTLQAYQQSLAGEPILIGTALLAVYIVLGMLYESLIHPLTVLSTLPSASVGAMLALELFHLDLSIIAIIGIVLLIGIVKKNAIMMIDFALAAERQEGKAPEAAIREACSLRFRPILMTTMAAMFGALPLALGTGMGGELRQPLGVSIVGGLLLSQLLTLYTTPVVYLSLDRLRLRGRRRRERVTA